MKLLKQNTFFCFSPPVMIVTFVIELVLLVAVLLTRKKSKNTSLVILILGALAFFQLCEYFVCGGFGINGATWSRLGFISITTLPPLGLHLIHRIAGKRSTLLVPTGYLLMALWIVVFGFTEAAFNSHACTGNYVIFDLKDAVGYLYSAYYYGLLLAGIVAAIKYGHDSKKKYTREALYGMIVGYVAFMLPTAIVNTLNPATLKGIPSIMCGFAILFALLLYGYIVPRITEPKR